MRPEDDASDKKKLKLIRSGHSIAQSLSAGNLEKAFAKSVVSGIKLAEENPFKNPLISPAVLVGAIKELGIEALVWKPETLFAAIDRKWNGWTDAQVGAALDSFHENGVLKTDVPPLVRQKVYAIRIIATSDTPHNEWHVFEKVGGALNDRMANFSVVEKLSPGECARTIAFIEDIRPDDYSKEVKSYIAASAHEEGLLTLECSKWLRMADSQLQTMNENSMGTTLNYEVRRKIEDKVKLFKSQVLVDVSGPTEDLLTIQALKILAIDTMGDQAWA